MLVEVRRVRVFKVETFVIWKFLGHFVSESESYLRVHIVLDKTGSCQNENFDVGWI